MAFHSYNETKWPITREHEVAIETVCNEQNLAFSKSMQEKDRLFFIYSSDIGILVAKA